MGEWGVVAGYGDRSGCCDVGGLGEVGVRDLVTVSEKWKCEELALENSESGAERSRRRKYGGFKDGLEKKEASTW